jgi:hypothetical protein
MLLHWSVHGVGQVASNLCETFVKVVQPTLRVEQSCNSLLIKQRVGYGH